MQVLVVPERSLRREKAPPAGELAFKKANGSNWDTKVIFFLLFITFTDGGFQYRHLQLKYEIVVKQIKHARYSFVYSQNKNESKYKGSLLPCYFVKLE